MLNTLIHQSIRNRWLVLAIAVFLMGLGVWSFQRLPIDATPDITNVQVQINSEAEGFSPLESEQRVTFPVETAIAGVPGTGARVDLDFSATQGSVTGRLLPTGKLLSCKVRYRILL